MVLTMSLLMMIVVLYIDNGINSYDMRFYYGKDNGYFRRIESIVIFSTMFFLVLSRNKRLLYTLYGFITGLISVIVSYVFISILLNKLLLSNTDLVFHFFAIGICIFWFFILERLLNRNKDNQEYNRLK